jgi:hypothetical protein
MTMGVPLIGVMDLQAAPAARATGSSGPRSAASTTAVNLDAVSIIKGLVD